MAFADNQNGKDGGIVKRLTVARLPLAATALVLGGLWLFGALEPLPAVAAFAVIALAIVLAQRGVAAGVAVAHLDRERAGEALSLLGPVLAGLPQATIALNGRSEVVALNSPARAIAPALRPGEPVSLGLRVPEVLDALRRALAAGTPQRVEFIDRVPVERWYEAVVVPVAISGPAQADGLVLVTLNDLTPLRRVEEMRADFVANASHELRTPLATLSGFIETLQGAARDDPEARERFLSIMQAQATRMARLIGDLLSLSRIELNAHLRPTTPVELHAIVRQVVDGLQTLARDRGVAIDVTAPAAGINVRGDRDELLRVFENLVENALKYAASGKRVDVVLSTDGARNEARVAVRDYGSGIAPEHLPRLTERFYRVDVTDSRAQGGTGLGLALVKHILSRHGGRLSIESVYGEGATFTAVLPLSPDASAGPS